MAFAAAQSFEDDEGFAAGSDIAAESGWKGSTPGAGTVSTEQANGGTQSLKVATSEEGAFVKRTFAIPEKDVIFIDFDILPCADASESPAATLDANGVTLGFVKEKDHGHIYVVPPFEKDPATDTGFDFAIDEENGAQRWIRVTIRQDLKAKTWDIYLDGKLTLIDQSISSEPQGNGVFAVYGSPVGDAYLDNVTIGSVNPLFPDADSDGMPDAEEMLNKLNPAANDRNVASDQPGLSNIQQFLATGSLLRDALYGRNVVYVDNLNGSDAFSGGISYRMGNDGPVASLVAALRLASKNTTIAIMGDGNAYVWPEGEANSREADNDINIVPLVEINIHYIDKTKLP